MNHTIHHQGWAKPATPAALPEPAEAARGLALTDRAIFQDGVGIVPVSGEIHYSRLPRDRWSERLRQLRTGGVTLASTYVFWNHHVAERAAPRFDGQLDVAAFIDACAEAGLDVVLRIGPWAHGEARYGGFPDWVADADVVHRTDDPAYLALVREWFGQLADALGGRAQPGGPIVAIQLDNELYDQPGHLVTLKRLAREAGMAAPLWTATGWGGAQLPAGEVLPLFGGYADGFWADPEDGWHPNFRAHFFPSHDWDDPGVGADVRAAQGTEAAVAAASAPAELHGFPPATCELGSGMATAYHRRVVLAARDIAALAQVKIGNGSAWQGFFMYVGGRNPAPGLQETIATGYPNDMPEFGYDFHAPIGQSGDLHESAAPLRDQHAFLAAFGDRLAGMTSSLPDVRPTGLDDRRTLRWALRSDGDEGFVLISHHQPYEQVEAVTSASFTVSTDAGNLTFPASPLDIPAGTLARWPLGLRVGRARVRWATASALTLLPGDAPDAPPTLVLTADEGIAVELALDDRDPQIVEPGGVTTADGADILVLSAGAPVWVQELPGGARRLFRTTAELTFDGDDTVRTRGEGDVELYDPAIRGWRTVATGVSSLRDEAVTAETVRAAGEVPTDYGFGGLRQRAPETAVVDERAEVLRLDLPAWAIDPGADAVLDIDWAGDVGALRVDGRTVDDRFWDGERWTVSLRDAGVSADSEVTLHLLPLAAGSTVGLATAAAARRAKATGALLATDRIAVRERGPWRELTW